MNNKKKNLKNKEILRSFIENSFTIDNHTVSDLKCEKYVIRRNGEQFTLTVFIRNITSAYLSYDPSVERIIIPVIPEISKTTKNSAFLLAGYKKINDKNIIVFWNPMRYTHHKTNRSVFVYPRNIDRIYENGFFSCTDHNNMIYGCDENNFYKVLEAYVEDTYNGEDTW